MGLRIHSRLPTFIRVEGALPLALLLLPLFIASLPVMIPCGDIPNDAAATVPLDSYVQLQNESTASNVLVLNRCRWSAPNVEFTFSHQAVHLVLRGVRSFGGSFLFTANGSQFPSGCSIEITDVVVTSGGVHVFSVDAESISSLELNVFDSQLTAETSALSFFSNVMTNVSLLIKNSIVTVQNADHRPARAAALHPAHGSAMTLSNIIVGAVQTSIEAVSAYGNVAAVGVSMLDVGPTTVTVDGMLLFAESCTLNGNVSNGNNTAAVMGVTASSSAAKWVTISLTNVEIFGHDCNVTVSGSDASAWGVASHLENCGVAQVIATISDSVLHFSHSSVLVITNAAIGNAAALGVAIFTSRCGSPDVKIKNTTLLARSSSAVARGSRVTILGITSTSILGHCLYSITDDCLFASVDSSLESYGGDSAVVLGIASSVGSYMNILLSFKYAVFYAEGSLISSNSPGRAASLGFVATTSGHMGSSFVEDVSLIAHRSIVKAEGKDSRGCCATLGWASSFCQKAGCNGGVKTTNFALFSDESEVETISCQVSAAVGLAVFKFNGNLQSADVTLSAMYACSSTVIASGSQSAAVGVAAIQSASLDALWLLHNVRIVSARYCMNSRPTAGGSPSAMQSVDMDCVSKGSWTSVADSTYFTRNISMDGVPCDWECIDTAFPTQQSENVSTGGVDLMNTDFCSILMPSTYLPRPYLFWAVPTVIEPTKTSALTVSESIVPSLSVTTVLTQSKSAEKTMSRGTVSSSGTYSLTHEAPQSLSISISPNAPPTRTATASSSQFEPYYVKRTLIGILISSPALRDVASVAPATVLLAGTVSPGSVIQIVRLSAVVRAIQCILSADDDDPGTLEYPLQFELGSGSRARFAGGCLTDVIIVVVIHLTEWALVCVERQRESVGTPTSTVALHARRIMVSLASLSIGFFLPSIAGGAAVLLFCEERTDAELAIAIISLCAWAAVGAWPLGSTIALRRFASWTVDTSRDDKINVQFRDVDPSSKFVERFSSYFGDANDPSRAACRLVYFEDVISASFCSFCASCRPDSASCLWALVPVVALCVAHSVYLSTVRPYNRKLSAFFSAFTAVNLTILAVLGLLLVYEIGDAMYVAIPAVVQRAMFIVQTVVVLTWAAILAVRRRKNHPPDEVNGGASSALLAPTELCEIAADGGEQTAQGGGGGGAVHFRIGNPLKAVDNAAADWQRAKAETDRMVLRAMKEALNSCEQSRRKCEEELEDEIRREYHRDLKEKLAEIVRRATPGTFLWSAVISSGDQFTMCSGGKFFYAAMENYLFAFVATSGSLLWNTQLRCKTIYSLSVAEEARLVFASSDDLLSAHDDERGGQKWKLRFYPPTLSAPVLTPRSVLVQVGACVYSIGIADGDVQWQCERNSITTEPQVGGSGDLVYFGVKHMEFNGIYAVSSTSGAVVWSSNAGARESSPVVADGVVFFGGCTLCALDAATGAEKWLQRVDNNLYAKFHSLVVAAGIVYVKCRVGSSSQYLCTFRVSDGTFLMRTRIDAFDDGILAPFSPTAATTGQEEGSAAPCWFFASEQRTISAINPTTGTPAWSYIADFAVPPLCVADGVCYLPHVNQLGFIAVLALNAFDGRMLWTCTCDNFAAASSMMRNWNAVRIARPLCHKRIVFVADSEGHVLAVSADIGGTPTSCSPIQSSDLLTASESAAVVA